MWRYTPILLILVSGCADCFHDCLLQDSILGDLVRCLPCNKKSQAPVPTEGEVVTVNALDGQVMSADEGTPVVVPK